MLIQSEVKKGCHVVPIGHPYSPNCESEWRLSFSVVERTLVWSFNDTHRKCYVLLQTHCLQFIGKSLPDVLCSYHMKTLMFWSIEESDTHEWCTENLLNNLLLCISRLRQWISEGNVPSYFIPGNNLVDYKLTPTIQCVIIRVLDDLITNLGGSIHENKNMSKLIFAQTDLELKYNSVLQRGVQTWNNYIFQTLVAIILRFHSESQGELRIHTMQALLLCTPEYGGWHPRQLLNKQQSVLTALHTSNHRTLTTYQESLVESNIGSIRHVLHKTERPGDEHQLRLARKAFECGTETLPGFGHLRLANLHYLEHDFTTVCSLLEEVDNLFTHPEDMRGFYWERINARWETSTHMHMPHANH
jgi:hypothetical protein